MVAAICNELTQRRDYLLAPEGTIETSSELHIPHQVMQEVATIYLGGGTPSICTNEQLQQIFTAIRAQYPISSNAEITLEANPDDITPEKLAAWQLLGVNRLSIGVQSFREEDLQWMNRAHNAQQVWQSLQWAKEAGFNNISIDLIYGTPTLGNEAWLDNLDKALGLGIPHLSCYALTVEPKTALEKMIKLQKIASPEAERQAIQFELLQQWAAGAGYEQYEISNFALPNWRSKHNSSYWQQQWYLGIGPSAHSFNGTSRQWNIANNVLYIQSIQSGTPNLELETLTQIQQLNEYIMTSLRTMEGLSLAFVTAKWGEETAASITEKAKKIINSDHVLFAPSHLQLTPKGKLYADGIAADLFFEEQ